MALLNIKELRKFLEESFSDRKDEITGLNKYYKSDTSFLYRTYCVEWPFERGNSIICITVFQDLPYPLPQLILERIKYYLSKNKIEAGFQYWVSYQAFKDIDPVRVLRN